MTVITKVQVFYSVTPCELVPSYQHFERIQRFCFQRQPALEKFPFVLIDTKNLAKCRQTFNSSRDLKRVRKDVNLSTPLQGPGISHEALILQIKHPSNYREDS